MKPMKNRYDPNADPNLFRTVNRFNRLLSEKSRPPNGQWEFVLRDIWTSKGASSFLSELRKEGYEVLERSTTRVNIAGTTGERMKILVTHPDMEKLKNRNHLILAGGAFGLIFIIGLLYYLTCV
jgi:hypothetical protein